MSILTSLWPVIEPLTGDVIVSDVYLMADRACPQLLFTSLSATGDLI